jgi:adenosylhomocysteine nucleosidase
MTTQSDPRPVFIAALPREIAGLVNDRAAGWQTDDALSGRNIHVYWNDYAIVACAGMGAHRASLAIEAALAVGPASELVSVGWAGACIHRLHVGDLVHPDIVVDAKTGERYFPNKERGKNDGLEILVTVETPSGVAAKERLGVSYYATAVDMEAAAVARIARAHDLPFSAIKAISDEASFELPEMQEFTTSDGQFREAAFGLRVAMRPRLWKPVATLAKSSRLAAGLLQAAIKVHIADHISVHISQRRKRTP